MGNNTTQQSFPTAGAAGWQQQASPQGSPKLNRPSQSGMQQKHYPQESSKMSSQQRPNYNVNISTGIKTNPTPSSVIGNRSERGTRKPFGKLKQNGPFFLLSIF